MSLELLTNPPPIWQRSEQDPTQFIRRSSFFCRGSSYPRTPELALDARNTQLGVLRVCGVKVPETKTLGRIRKNETEGRGLTVVESVEFVEGEPLSELMIAGAPIDVKTLNDYYKGLTRYLGRVHKYGGYYLSDVSLNNNQAVLGKRTPEADPSIYMVDVEPILERFEVRQPDEDFSNPEPATNQLYYRCLNGLGSIINLASSFGYDVSESRKNFDRFYNTLPPSIYDGVHIW